MDIKYTTWIRKMIVLLLDIDKVLVHEKPIPEAVAPTTSLPNTYQMNHAA